MLSLPKLSSPARVSALIGFVALLMIVVGGVGIWRMHQEMRTRLVMQAETASYAVSAHVQWLVGASRQTLSLIDRLIGPDVSAMTDAQKEAVREILEGLPSRISAWVIDANGNPVFSTDGDALDVSVADRDYFQELREGATNSVSSLIVGSKSGTQMFVIARRLVRDGAFAGAVTMSFPAVTLSDFWSRLGLGGQSTVSIFRNDGKLVARYPLPDGPIDLRNYVLFTDHLRRARHGVYDALSPADGVSRIVGYTKVDGENLVALASVATGEPAAEVRARAVRVASVLAAILIILGLVTAWLVRSLRREDANRAELTAALDQNRLLFQEIHHRVKNNLQAVSSLIQLQPIAPEYKAQLVQRIGAMIAIHEQAYRSDEYAVMSVPDYLARLVERIRSVYGEKVEVTTDFTPISIKRDLALPLGLVANEILSNAMKHAFPDGRSGIIRVVVRRLDGERGELEISDNGVGLDTGAESTGIGSRLIRGFVAQLGGDADTEVRDGTIFRLRFPAIAA